MRSRRFAGLSVVLLYSLASVLAEDRTVQTVRLTERSDFTRGAKPPHDSWRFVTSLAFSPDGSLLAVAGSFPSREKASSSGDRARRVFLGPKPAGGVELWNAVDASRRELLADQPWQEATGIALAPDGRSLAVGFGDWRRAGEILLYDLSAKKVIGTLRGHAGWVRGIAYAPDGATLISCGSKAPDSQVAGGELWLWDLKKQQGKRIWQDEEATLARVAYAPDGKSFAVGGCRFRANPAQETSLVQIHDATTAQLRQLLTDQPAGVEAIAYAPDGESLVSASSGWGLSPRRYATLVFRNARLGKIIEIVNVGQWYPDEVVARIGHLAFSSDGKLLAVAMGSWNRGGQWAALRLYNVEKKALEADTPVYAQKVKPVVAAAFSPDGKSLAAAYGVDSVKVWDVIREPSEK
jgi:WD40 repeat protein